MIRCNVSHLNICFCSKGKIPKNANKTFVFLIDVCCFSFPNVIVVQIIRGEFFLISAFS